MKSKRYGNVENRNNRIVLWYTNPYYGSEGRLISEGWTKDNYGSFHKGNSHINNSCFKNKESCITIAYVEEDTDEYTTKLVSVGERLLSLTKQERKDFFKVYEYMHNEIIKGYEKELYDEWKII